MGGKAISSEPLDTSELARARRVAVAVLGNGEKGLVQRVADLEKQLARIEEENEKFHKSLKRFAWHVLTGIWMIITAVVADIVIHYLNR